MWRDTADEFTGDGDGDGDGDASRVGAAPGGAVAAVGTGVARSTGTPAGEFGAGSAVTRADAPRADRASAAQGAPAYAAGGVLSGADAARADAWLGAAPADDRASGPGGTGGPGEATATDATAAGGAPAVALAGDSHATPGPTAGGHGVNHDKSFRPRRQDRPQDLLETGAAYAMDAAGLRKHQHRFFGRTELVRTDPARVLEIDDPHDLARAQALAPLFDANRPGALPTYDDIDAVVLDFDGTQTDDRVLIDSDGREFVSVHRGDGLGIAALRRSGLTMLILSSEKNPVVAARARKLQIPVLHGIDRKDLALKQWCEEQGIAPERVLYVGNDVNDLPCFALVGWPVAVGSAHDVVRGAARAVTTVPGGEGAIREIAGWILGPSLDSLDPLDK
ncbi:HAD hydrolase family protein [Streptomyces sp. NBC_00104]|uniref:HAD hydrolase family protein n=1 Tax=Streptomyces sp. NBC_00104 TaxID=2903621 RepID=UPI00386F2BDF